MIRGQVCIQEWKAVHSYTNVKLEKRFLGEEQISSFDQEHGDEILAYFLLNGMFNAVSKMHCF